jgi:hypothetical protein
VLERLDRALGLAEDRRRLGVREVEDELQRQHLLLLAGELVDQLEHRLAADRLERALLGGGRLVGIRLRHLLLGCQRARRKWSIARLWAIRKSHARTAPTAQRTCDRLEHLQERLRRQVLGVVAVADADVQVAVDAVEVDQVQLFERGAVAGLRASTSLRTPLASLRRADESVAASGPRVYVPRSARA